MDDIISCIDIGTTKVCAFVARLGDNGNFEVLGKAMEPCSGVKKGVIVDIDSVSNAIRSCIQKVRALLNVDIESVYVNVMGSHIDVFYNKASVDVLRHDHQITSDDVEKVLKKVEDVKLPENVQIIDVIPRQYIVDGCDEILDPVGMAGVKLELEADVVVGKITTFNNIIKSVENANVAVNGFIAESLAVGDLALNPEEKEMGAILIDVGGGVTNISVFKSKCLVLYDSIPVGGEHITNDISIGLKVSLNDAEKLKREYGLALTSLINNDHDITINELSENTKRTIKVSEVVEIIEARTQEIFSLCREMLEQEGILSSFNGGVVLAGGGISYIDGSIQSAKEIFGLPVRIVSYKSLGIKNAEHVTAMATINYVANRIKSEGKSGGTKNNKPRRQKQKKEYGFLKKIANLFNGLF
ncbi:cell division protein FtsA [Acetivibrio mesophilus]|uniref:Cell division protein FtsA n=1 Tax=Acetivibrio mesophilus TaxID=2487273 RepID=A0A4Q0I8L6_9FIRM|nr:cell division protein FtsA [Acetivibrio mesophilus]ODM25702.1 cell division protein FtsA [Clostridium sp. Bc-iso-3]RXE60285.1 cell division protein FtsA [Acetivibrio mesophilus]HHV29842.1 cell division protein FtsA [Clostridium sp.]